MANSPAKSVFSAVRRRLQADTSHHRYDDEHRRSNGFGGPLINTHARMAGAWVRLCRSGHENTVVAHFVEWIRMRRLVALGLAAATAASLPGLA